MEGLSTLAQVSRQDRIRWDERYADRGPVPLDAVGPPRAFKLFEDLFPTAGQALDLACGQGKASVWLALRGMSVMGVDVSAVAIAQARELARCSGIHERCEFAVVDLDGGLPKGPPADVILCHRFRDDRLDAAIVNRLAPGGLLAISACSEIGMGPGPFRVAAGALQTAFAELDVIATGEEQGQAWLLARR